MAPVKIATKPMPTTITPIAIARPVSVSGFTPP
jgi:hypothetical protein